MVEAISSHISIMDVAIITHLPHAGRHIIFDFDHPSLQAISAATEPRSKLGLPLDIVWRLFTEYLKEPSPINPDSSWDREWCKIEERASLKKVLPLRLVCKEWAVVGQMIAFRRMEIGHYAWARKYRDKYAPLLNASGSALRQCIRSLSWTFSPLTEQDLDVTMMNDYFSLPNLREIEVDGRSRCQLRRAGGSDLVLPGGMWRWDPNFRSFFKWEDGQNMMHKLVFHHLHHGILTSLTLSNLKQVPLLDFLSSPTLERLILHKTSFAPLSG